MGFWIVPAHGRPRPPCAISKDHTTDYAEVDISEYWIVDPQLETVTVLTLAGGAYAEHGVFTRGESATSPLLEGLALDVTGMFSFAKA